MASYAIRVAPVMRPLLLVIGGTKRKTVVVVGEHDLELRFGWFEARIRYSEIESVDRASWPFIYGLGLRIAPKKTLGLVGTSKDCVAIQLSEGKELKVPFRLWRERIVVSLEEPYTFIEDVRSRLK